MILALLLYVHSWYPVECCRNDNDCHPVACDELTETKAGIKWKTYTFTGKQIRPSQDGDCHVCAVENKYGIQGWCVFVSPES